MLPCRKMNASMHVLCCLPAACIPCTRSLTRSVHLIRELMMVGYRWSQRVQAIELQRREVLAKQKMQRHVAEGTCLVAELKSLEEALRTEAEARAEERRGICRRPRGPD